MTKTWYIVLVVVVALGAVLLFAPKSAPNGELSSGMPAPGAGDAPEMIVTPKEDISGSVEVPPGITVTPVPLPPPTITAHVVKYTDGGFSPAPLTVKRGNTVTWQNDASRNVWPASAVHPTHTAYPTAGGCLGSTFDACRGLASGESWSFVFNEIGTWRYHDHLRTSMTGTIVVE
ncbi:MAG: hypothetical protein Q8P88_00975 [Candidatus Jorgensenbacteria bacterium]|nr:hypothetical protein [Candidatus Jorgensenbacteria bacterium]